MSFRDDLDEPTEQEPIVSRLPDDLAADLLLALNASLAAEEDWKDTTPAERIERSAACAAAHAVAAWIEARALRERALAGAAQEVAN